MLVEVVCFRNLQDKLHQELEGDLLRAKGQVQRVEKFENDSRMGPPKIGVRTIRGHLVQESRHQPRHGLADESELEIVF